MKTKKHQIPEKLNFLTNPGSFVFSIAKVVTEYYFIPANRRALLNPEALRLPLIIKLIQLHQAIPDLKYQGNQYYIHSTPKFTFNEQ
jgi:hypothetical protein